MKRLIALLTGAALTLAGATAFASPVATGAVYLLDPNTDAAYVAGAAAPATATGTITTQNLVPTGIATANSAVEITVSGNSSLTAQTTGTYTASGGLSAQSTVDGVTWVTICSSTCATTFRRTTTGASTATVTSGEQDIYSIAIPVGAKKIRVTALGAVTGTSTVTLQTAASGGSSGAGGGGTSDATAANQTTQISHESRLTSSAGPNTAGSPLSTTAFQVGGRYLTSPATMTNGQEAGITLTADQQLRVASTVADGSSVSLGAKADAAAAGDTSTASAIALFKRLAQNLTTVNTSINTVDSVSGATLTNVAASATSVTCLASNTSRRRAIVFNDSATATLYIKAGATASTSSFTWELLPGSALTLDISPIYTGILDCIWSSASGNARVTEF